MDGRQRTRLGCGLVLLLGAAVIGLAIYIRATRSGGPVATADRFLALLARGKGDEAYADAAPGLRARKPPGMLTLEARHLGFTSYAGASWDEIDVTGNEATLEGSVTTRSGDVIPLVVKLVQLENQWRVLSVTLSPPERDEPGGETTPDE